MDDMGVGLSALFQASINFGMCMSILWF